MARNLLLLNLGNHVYPPGVPILFGLKKNKKIWNLVLLFHNEQAIEKGM
jgi:hypothetical protein